MYALHKHSQQAESKLRKGLEEKREHAEQRAKMMHDKARELKKKYEEMLQQEECDNDQEFQLQRAAQQRALAHEREVAQTLKGEAAILRKKFEAFQVEMEETKNVLHSRERDIKQLQKDAAEREKAMM